jgi:hypothetical protein
MTTNINLNLNQSPYFDDYDETKDFHQVLYKPAVAVQARELTQEQTIIRNQLKRFGDHVFANGSKVTGGELTLNLDYEYIKLQQQYNLTNINVATFAGKTVVGSQSGTKALVLNTSAIDATTGDPDTIFVKYITGGALTDVVQGIDVTAGGNGFLSTPTVTITGGGGTGALAIAVISSGSLYAVDITNGGSGYTSIPTVTISGGSGTGSQAVSTLTTSPAFLGGERISATDLSISALAAASLPTGTGSAVSINSGVFYVNGNFINIGANTLILDKYTNTPSYKVGLQVTASIISSGDDTTLLDNAQGSYNYAAPGADRLKFELALTKKAMTSIDDTDFYELLRTNNGIKEKDIQIPIYTVLEETFGRRTFDESGSYTVRAFNVQLKDDPNDTSKFIFRLDPGKAYIEGLEYETIVSSDLIIDKAREFENVNNFDRLIQYGNYVVVKDYSGLFNITEHATVDLHNVAHASVVLTTPVTYVNTKIGTAKVRAIDYVSGVGTAQVLNMYLYDITMSSSNFESIESIVVPVDANVTPVVLGAKSNIDDSGKVGGVVGGNVTLYESTFNSMVFQLPQETIKTIRDSSGNVDTSYTTKRVFENVTFTAGQATLSTAGSTETFFGTGALSVGNKREYYTTTIRTVGTSGLTIGEQVAFDGTGQTITVNGPTNTTITLNDNTGTTSFTADIIATINVDVKSEKTKSFVKNKEVIINTPNTTTLNFDSMGLADVHAIKAVYDSGNLATNPTLPTLTVASTVDTFTPGEIITGGTSGATGTVIVGASGTTSVTYVVVSGTFVAETITGGTSGFIKVASSVAAGDTEISSKYSLDTGQKDNFYDHGKIKLTSATAPTGRITAIIDYFTHSGTGYLSADSYTGSTGYDNVPTYTSPVTGVKVELRDCIDFRPRRADGGTAIQNSEVPIPNTNWSADYSFYLPRVDTVYLSRSRTFGVNTGVSSNGTTPPNRLDGTMDLYTVYVPAYTFNASDVTTQYIENKRYTMRDIGRLEKRIQHVEYYTSLSLLEKESEALDIKDTAGLDRFKNGILVDAFMGHSVGNVLSADHKCSIDFKQQIMRPPFVSNNTDVIYDSSASTGVTKTGDLITLPFTSTPVVTQTVASKAINVNPFAVLAWIGNVELNPPSDNWIDTANRPEVIVNLQGENSGWESLVGLGFGSQWDDWQQITTGGFGEERVTEISRSVERQGRWPWIRQVTTEHVERDTLQVRRGIQNTITGTNTVRNSIGDRIVDVSIVPFIRSRTLTISVTGMKPNTRVYPFFDNEAIAAYCTPSGGSLGGNIYTDNAGSIAGLTYAIPNSDTLRFRTGERQFLLVDNTVGDLVTASTYGMAIYQAQGMLQTKENVIVSTRVPRVEQGGMGSAADVNFGTESFTRNHVGGWYDPLAETFLIDGTLHPDGVFISDVDLYFKSKDTDGLPVSIQIRTTTNGYPTRVIVPFTHMNKLPADVNVSEDASLATNFAFSSPVFLKPGEYSLVVLSNSLKYETYIAEVGENIIGTTRKVSEQPYAGVLFKSQNASTWTAEQNQDMMFQINRNKFTIDATAQAVFKDSTGGVDVKADMIHLTPQEIRHSGTNIAWGVRMTDGGTNVLATDYTNVIQGTNYPLTTQKLIGTAAGTYVAKATLTSTSDKISPIIDTARNSVITIENIVNNLSTNEETSSGGDALARYVTRRVNLKDGFDATDLTVFVSCNRQAGTSIKVYYKILSQFDSDTFDNRPWQLMAETTNTVTVSGTDNASDYLELQFDPAGANANYTSSGVVYNSFKNFAIKIVMNSATTSTVPLLKDLRVIALA